MRRVALALVLIGFGGPVGAAPLYDSVSLNIGLNCQWQARCIAQQRKAMKRALSYVSRKQPAAWRIHQCNRNAARKRYRVDWVGFDNCIRNATLKAPRVMVLKRGRKIA
jgi:hypothetical protein